MNIERIAIGFMLTAALFFLGSPTSSFGAVHQYALVRNTTPNEGAYFFARNVSMNSEWSTFFPCRYLVKTQWLGFDGDNPDKQDWIEIGRLHGPAPAEISSASCEGIPVRFYDAYYTASGKYDSSGQLTYSESLITGFRIDGSHNWQIQRTGSSEWTAYIDYTAVRKYAWAKTHAVRHDVGWETNSSAATWESPNYAGAIQLLINGIWKTWTTGQRLDYNSLVNAMKWYADFLKKPDGTTDYSAVKYWRE
jgi:hypothetical protein